MAALLREATEEDKEERRAGDDSFRLQSLSLHESVVIGHTYDLNQISSDEETDGENKQEKVAGMEDSGWRETEASEVSALPDNCEWLCLC